MRIIRVQNRHWMLFPYGHHAGMHMRGKCWTFRFYRHEYETCTFYGFWWFFVSIEK